MPIHSLILDFIYAYIACLAFTLIYNMRGKFVLLAPLGGSIAWIIRSEERRVGKECAA